MTLVTVPQPAPWVGWLALLAYRPESSSISVTRAAIWDRSDRTSVVCANSGWPLSFSITAITPSCRPTRRLSRCAMSWVSTTREPEPIRDSTVSSTPRSSDCASSTITNASCSDRPLMWVSGSTSNMFLAADRVQRPEHDDLTVLPPLHHRLEPGAQRQRGLAGAGPAAERHDADLRIEQEVQRDPLLRAAAAQAEGLPVAPHQLHRLVRPDAAERAAVGRGEDEAGVTGKIPGGLVLQGA